ncbi:MAG: hypothetical protein CMJ40_07920 [Phycisphaerae bacterium]|nr:hypothetical protein [Phycisphaerae bacterium]|tara:strand:- start:129 stop:683 length:555 start_codon:yes stop_codon:yes gene_type:complete
MIDPASTTVLKGGMPVETMDRSSDKVVGNVTIEDLIRNWGESDSHADLNADGIVDVDDLLLLLEQQSSSNPVINSLMEAPTAAIEGLASLGGLLMEALGMQNPNQQQLTEIPDMSAADALDLSGMQPADVDTAMKTAKGMIDRWQSRGYISSPPPGFEQVIDTLPLDRDLRGVIAKLIEATYSS